MNELVSKVKKIKGIGVIAVLFVAAAVLLLFSGNIFAGGSAEPPASLDVTGLDAYAASLEARIKELISPISGVGDARVMVYLSSTEEHIYDTSGRDARLTKVVSPRVSGVAIVCSGGNDPAVRAKLTGIVVSLFGIGSHNVYISGP